MNDPRSPALDPGRTYDHLSNSLGDTDDGSNPGMAVLPFVEHVELETDPAVDHQLRSMPETGRRHQSDGMGAPFVDVDDFGPLPTQVRSKPANGDPIDETPQRQAEKGGK